MFKFVGGDDMVKLTVNFYGKGEVFGGCEEFFNQFKLVDPAFQHVSYKRASTAVGNPHTPENLGFFEIEGALILDEYLKQYEQLFKPKVIVRNGWCGGYVKLKTPTIAIHQDVHHTAARILLDRGMYTPYEFNRVGVVFPDIQKKVAALAVKNIAVSPFVQEKFRELGIETKVIPHGVDLKQFREVPDRDVLREKLRKEFKITQDHIGLWVGRFHPQKGWHIMRELIKSYPNIHWICLFSAYHNKKRRLKNATLLQPAKREDMFQLYNLADFYCMTSCTESFSLTSLEAMACNTPVLGHNTGILYSLNKDFGLKTNEWNPKGFKEIIDNFLQGQKFNPQKVAEQYSMEKWKKAWKEVIHSTQTQSSSISKQS